MLRYHVIRQTWGRDVGKRTGWISRGTLVNRWSRLNTLEQVSSVHRLQHRASVTTTPLASYPQSCPNQSLSFWLAGLFGCSHPMPAYGRDGSWATVRITGSSRKIRGRAASDM